MIKNEKIAIYPGTFDPITLGHVDIINRACKLCDKLIIAPAVHHSKKPTFTSAQRTEMIHVALQECGIDTNHSIEVIAFDGLLAEFALRHHVSFIIRGLRTMSDFDYELQMVGVNQQLEPSIDTVFLPADSQKQFISSSLAKQIFHYNGKLSGFLPDKVQVLMKQFIADR